MRKRSSFSNQLLILSRHDQERVQAFALVAFRYLAARSRRGHAILLKDTFDPPAIGAKPDVLKTLPERLDEYRRASL